MCCEEETAVALRQAGMRVTPQRLVTASALRHAGGAATAAVLLAGAQRRYAYLDAAIMYRSLATLRGVGLVRETGPCPGRTYVWTGGAACEDAGRAGDDGRGLGSGGRRRGAAKQRIGDAGEAGHPVAAAQGGRDAYP